MRKRSRREEEAFQMAPMIDMVFLLLVFFMTVSTLAKEARPGTPLPESATAEVPVEIPPRPVLTVLPGKDGARYYWFNRPVEAGGLPDLMRAAVESGDSGLLLRGPPELPWEAWGPVREAIRKAGITEVIFATLEE